MMRQTFSGTFAGHAKVVNFASDSSGFGMTASGTGAPHPHGRDGWNVVYRNGNYF